MHRRVSLLQAFLEGALYGVEQETQSVRERFGHYLSEHASAEDVSSIAQWDESVFLHFTQTNLGTQMAEVKKGMELLPVVTLYIPVVFDESGLKDVVGYLRERIHPQLLATLHIDPASVGGCQFVHNDRLHDLSLRARMERSPGIVTELLDSYVSNT
jgi:hypothetical protein